MEEFAENHGRLPRRNCPGYLEGSLATWLKSQGTALRSRGIFGTQAPQTAEFFLFIDPTARRGMANKR